jgi:PAS domain S-box-containing protein
MKIYFRICFCCLLLFILPVHWIILRANEQKATIVVRGDIYYPPFEFMNENGEPDGFNVELFRLISKELGLKYSLKLEPWSNVWSDLESGEVDVILGMMVSEKRAQKINFGIPHSVMTHGIFCRKNHSFKTIDELKGKEIVVQNLDRMHEYLIENQITDKIITANSQYEALKWLSEGKYDAALLGNFQGAHLIKKHKFKNISICSSNIEPQKYAMGVAKNNDELLWLLNMGLYQLKANGEYDKLYHKWFDVYENQNILTRYRFPIGIAAGILIMLTIATLLFRYRIQKATSALRNSNLKLKTENETRIRIEEELIQNERKFREIFNSTSDAIFIHDPLDGTILDCNETALELFGYSSKEKIKAQSLDSLHNPLEGSPRQKALDSIDEAIKKGSFTFEWQSKQKNGTWFWSEVTLRNSIINKQECVIAVVRNINERKISQIRLKENIHLLNQSQQASRIGSYTMQLPSGQWVGSLFLLNLFELEESKEYTWEDWSYMIHPNDKDVIIGYFLEEVLKKGNRFDKEYRILTPKTNTTYWVHGMGEPTFDNNNKITQLTGTVQDITEKIEAIDQLRKLSRAVDQSSNAIYITSQAGVIEYSNPALAQLTGYNNSEIVGNSPTMFNFYNTLDIKSLELWEAIQAGELWQGELNYKHKDGRPYWVLATISPIQDHNGIITHFLTICEDITASKKLTEELIIAKEHAEESDRLKSSFLANMSHEIRTPLNSIMGFASLLPDEDDAETIAMYSNIIYKNSEQLVSIIDEIVLYSKLQTHMEQLNFKHLTPSELFTDIQRTFSLADYPHSVQLIIDQTEDLQVVINSDYNKLMHILNNLLSNAFKFSKQGDVHLGCKLLINNTIKLYVSDSGIGIPQKEQSKIFERFFRASNVDQANTRGTGLGLSIANELVKLLNGKIGVESEEGKGSTFWITIPITI